MFDMYGGYKNKWKNSLMIFFKNKCVFAQICKNVKWSYYCNILVSLYLCIVCFFRIMGIQLALRVISCHLPPPIHIKWPLRKWDGPFVCLPRIRMTYDIILITGHQHQGFRHSLSVIRMTSLPDFCHDCVSLLQDQTNSVPIYRTCICVALD